MTERPGIIPKVRVSLAEAQVVQRFWERAILGEQGRDPATRVNRFMMEAVELGETKEGLTDHEYNERINQDPELRKAVAMEAVDTIIIALGVVDALGMDTEVLFHEKMIRNYQKYSLKRRQELVDGGMTPDEAVAEMKREWNLLNK